MLLPRKWALSLGLLVAVPGFAVAGPAEFPAGNASTAARPSDNENQIVADQISAALGQARLTHKDVEIVFQGGVATIRGQIKDAQQHAQVTRVVSSIPGVRSVENKLSLMESTVAAPAFPSAATASRSVNQNQIQQISYDAPSSNQEVAQNVADALASAGLSKYDIEVRVKNGAVSMIGGVDSREHAVLAQRAASSVPGVNEVLNRLTVNGRPALPQQPLAAPGAMAQQGAMPVNYQQMAAQGYPQGAPQGMPPQGMPPQGMPPQGMPPQGMPQYGNIQQAGHHMYNQPNIPNYAWPTYAAPDNSAAISYPTQYDASAFPYIGPYYPYPQVPLDWRKSTLEWQDGQWSLKFDSKTDKWWWFMSPKNWH